MAYLKIDIPGGRTIYEDAPSVQIVCTASSWASLIIKYAAAEYVEGQPQLYGEITFKNVMEYRWVVFGYDYSPYSDDEYEGEGFELIQITDSKQVEDMASKSPFRYYPGKRFGPVIDESRVKHFRISFDDYGSFDVIAFDVSVRSLTE